MAPRKRHKPPPPPSFFIGTQRAILVFGRAGTCIGKGWIRIHAGLDGRARVNLEDIVNSAGELLMKGTYTTQYEFDDDLRTIIIPRSVQ